MEVKNELEQPLVAHTPKGELQKSKSIVEPAENQQKHVESLYLMRRQKSIQSSKMQMNKLQEWMVEDKKYMNNSISITEITKFLSGNFEIIDNYNEKSIKQITEWEKIPPTNAAELTNNGSNLNNQPNIILKNKIIKLETPNFNLRSLAVDVEISLYMGGESCLWIFSRSLDKFTNDNVICYINKELESVRKFINFAIFEEGDNNNFSLKTLKKQEIPKHDMVYNSNLDISEIKVRFIDNGDNKCFVYIENDTNQKNFYFGADFFCPINDMTNIFLAASGDLISIKSMNVKQVARFSREYAEFDQLNKKSQQCNCCQIF